jgi:hypothetical protein
LISRQLQLSHRLTFVTVVVQFTAKEQADIRAAFAVHQLPEGTKEEQAAKAKAVESGVQGNGIRVRGIKFMCTKNTPDSIYGTKKVNLPHQFILDACTDPNQTSRRQKVASSA